MMVMVIGVCRLVSSLALATLLKHFHRRFMYFFSITLTIICLITFSSLSYFISQPQSLSSSSLVLFQWASLVSICLLVFSVQLGVQTLPLLLSGELFPADVRASCKGLTRAITCIFLIIFLPAVYLILPETKDLSLEMIQAYFA